MPTKKKIAAKTQPKRRPRSGKKTPRIELVVEGIERVLANRIAQLNADMHAEIGSIKSGNGKTDRLMAQNAQEFNILKSSFNRMMEMQAGMQSALNHAAGRLKALEAAAQGQTEPADCDQEKSRETRKISSRVAHSAILSRGLDRFLESLGFEVTE